VGTTSLKSIQLHFLISYNIFCTYISLQQITTYALTGSNGCGAYKGYTSAARIILWVSYNRKPENKRRPPYTLKE
jgi:hypothetical protein